MPTIRIVRGTHRVASGERAEQGDVVEVTERELDALPRYKYETVSDESDEGSKPTEDTEPEATVEEDLTSDTDEEDTEPEAEYMEVGVEELIPYDDYGMLSTMAADYDGDEIHGSMSGEEITEFFETLSVPEVQNLKRKAKGET